MGRLRFWIMFWVCLVGSRSYLLAQQPTLEWIHSAGGPGNEQAFGITADSMGHLFVIGTFDGVVTFGETTLTPIDEVGANDIFVTKYDADGTILWARHIGGPFEDEPGGIVADAQGNVYVTGAFANYVVLGTDTLTYHDDVQGLKVNLFLAKYAPEGRLVWARQADASSFSSATGLFLDKTGSIYVTGYFSHMVTFGTTTLEEVGGGDLFIARYDTAGNALWGQRAGGSGRGFGGDGGLSAATDEEGNAYVTGIVEGLVPVTFGELELTNNSESTNSAFVGKMDPKGEAVWAIRAQGLGLRGSWGEGIVADEQGNVYVSGRYRETIKFDAMTELTVDDMCDFGCWHFFLVKLDAEGQVVWARQMDADANGGNTGQTVMLDEVGNIHVVGHFGGQAVLGETILEAPLGEDLYMVGYDPEGTNLYAFSLGGPVAELPPGKNLATLHGGSAYLTGSFGMATFNDTTLVSTGGTDVFVAKVSSIIPTANDVEVTLPTVARLFPNFPNPFHSFTTFTFDLSVGGQVALHIYDLLGRAVATVFEGYLPAGRQTIQFGGRDLANGTYFYRLQIDTYQEAQIMTILR